MTSKPDMRHVKINNGATVMLLRERRRYIDTTFTELETIPAGTEGVVIDRVNAGFRGLEYHLRLADGSRLHGVPACDLVAFA